MKISSPAALLLLSLATFSCDSDNIPAGSNPSQPGTFVDRCDEACSRFTSCGLDGSAFCDVNCHHINNDLARPDASREYFSCVLDGPSSDGCNLGDDTECTALAADRVGVRDIDRTFRDRCLSHLDCGHDPDLCSDSAILKESVVQAMNACLDRGTCLDVAACLQGALGQ